ncbi:MAG: thiamine pyrophosphate-dependent dehydrogenase E1 component subunit alpha [Candidatus Thiodiazotropha sp. (ex Cardiolucina cf. quadrata)]|nr:thiamine pyrophosphate-dependent dehydrogenase E1 component subunit alpha [Candidatus Thiodiazotropha sp. (ex Cardiolucina cf. quadrata)]
MSLNKSQMVTLFTNLVRTNEYDLTMYGRMMAGKLLGFYHPGEGGIAPGVGACSFLNKDDFFSPHHRAHGMGHMLSKGIDLKTYLAEHTGKQGGCCAGRSSFHASYPAFNQFMYSGFIGYDFTPATGWGWAAKHAGKRQVVMMCSGDGSYGQGRAHEGMLMAANWKLPIIFWCENNGLAIHASTDDMHPVEHISSLALGFDIPTEIVDGQDVFACAEAALRAIGHCRSGKGPFFVECKTTRFREHDIGTPDLIEDKPRTEEMIDELKQRDPMVIATERVLADGILTQVEIDKIKEAAAKEVKDAWAWADAQPKAEPCEDELLAAVYAP